MHQIDKDIIPIVDWITQSNAIHIYSSQGSHHIDHFHPRKPSLIWTSQNPNPIIQKLLSFNPNKHPISITLELVNGNIRYHTQWENNQSLNEFTHYLKQNK